MTSSTARVLAACLTLSATSIAIAPATAAVHGFTNATPITILDDAAASVYPSPINVSGLTGSVSEVTVTLNGISHTWIGDLNALLVSPAGQKIILLGLVNTGGDFQNAQVTFSATAASGIPLISVVPSGTYLPTLSSAVDSPAPAPVGPYSTDLTTLNSPGAAQNGAWNLYVSDHAGADVGAISGGWSLSITTSFASCADEGYRGAKLILCRQVCESRYPPSTTNMLIQAWLRLYRTDPPCAAD